ncbi:MAG TPA: sialidase family protein [Bacteroidales bacterium]|nr:sialidase family protein [Bacteroidales bacterium]
MFRILSLFCTLFVLLCSPEPAESGSFPGDPIPVFPIGEGPYSCYRIPALLALPGGELLAFAEGRKTGCADFGDVDIVMKRSRDGGKSWSDMTVVAEYGILQAGNAAPVLDLTDPAFPEGRIFLFYNTGTTSEDQVRQGRGIREVWFITSSDQGHTWSAPINITMQVHRPNQPSFSPEYAFAEDWRAFANTPGHALQVRKGAHAGRLYVAANRSAGPPQEHYADGRSFGYFSDDHGQTFRVSEELHFPGSNEATAAETDGGGVYLNARNQAGSPRCRIAAFSRDGGESWDTIYYDLRLPDPVCEGTVLNGDTGGGNLLFFANPASVGERRDLTLRISRDGGKSWPDSLLLVNGEAAYSDLCRVGKKGIGCLFEKGSDGGIYFISKPF